MSNTYRRPSSNNSETNLNPESNLTRNNKELKEINEKIDSYIDAVRNEIQERRNSNLLQTNGDSQQQKHIEGSKEFSLKNLQKDLATLKLLYDDELRIMRHELDELAAVKNKYSLENFNLEVKLQDFFEKFEEIKKVNQSLVDELNEEKNKNNRLEYEIESLKIDADKPIRENRQLRKDLEDILKKINEKQEIANTEISYRQDLEQKYKELAETTLFERRLLETEIENGKFQVKMLNETVCLLENQLNHELKTQLQSTDEKSKRIRELEEENGDLQDEIRKLTEKNDYLKTFCDDLEQIVVRLDTVKKSFETDKSTKSDNFLEKNWTEEIRNIKTKMKSPIQRYIELPEKTVLVNPHDKKVSSAEATYEDDFDTEEVNNIIMNKSSYRRGSDDMSKIGSQNGNNFYPAQNQQNVKKIPQTPTQFIQSNPGTPLSNHNLNVRASSSLSANHQAQSKSGKIEYNKDFTAELFNNFERSIFQTKDVNAKPSVNPDIIDASYVGNVKIQEIHKSGSYIRLLNTSNTIEEDLGNFTIQQMIATMPVAVFRFPSPVKLAPGRIVSIWCNNDEVEQQPPHTFVWKEQNRWSTGPECTTVLSKPNGQAVSWTTGCHKYRNVDNDDHLSVYSPKRVQTPSCQINRKKLVAIFTPTKHPHGQMQCRTESSTRSPSEQRVTFRTDSASKNMFDDNVKTPVTAKSVNKFIRPVKSAIGVRSSSALNSHKAPRSMTTLNFRKSNNGDDSEEEDRINEQIYQENVRYFNTQKQLSNKQKQILI